MAKRGAGTELNHDNWDQDEESEEAGEFKKASDDQMKGRVIKKAKRRNLNEDQKKNVFAGFGGFTSSNATAQDAFSFLAKPADGAEVKTGGFSFGSSAAASTGGLFGSTENKTGSTGNGFSFGGTSNGNGEEKEKSAGFSFGSVATAEKDDKESVAENGSMKDDANNGDDLFSKFKPASGNWTCGACMVSNPADKSKCLACETPNPSATAAPKDDLFSKFKSSSSNWSCDVCLVSNPADKTKCLACETPNPKAATTTVPPADDLFAKFKSNSGNWSCDVCMISNDAAKEKCVACEAPKPGVQAAPVDSEAKPAFSFGEGGGFKFGGGSQAPASSTMSGFKFGSTDTTAEPKNDSNGGFKFGSSEPSKPEQTAGFKFGSSQPVEPTEQVSGFLFGSSSKEESVPGFKFGTDSPVPVKTSQVFKSAEGGFQFSSSEKVGTKINQEVTDTPKTKSKKGEYLANLKALNTQVTNWIKSHVDDNPLVDLTPVFKDYEKHINELRTKFNVQASIKSVNDTTSPSQTDDKEESKKDEPKPFSFGLNQTGFGNLSKGFGTNTSSFQFGFLKKDENKTDETKSDDEESVAATQIIETVVETDALYTKKCKLFYKKGDAYVERGLGNIHLKKTDESKLQVIIRAETTLGNILLNIIMTDKIPLERVGKNNVMIICVPNPPIDPKAESEPVTFLIRVKNGEDADELKDKLAELAKADN
eukprot:GFUD01028268.1.p1 GENE.GFUD01028268.1~~GFUD01028268.1.p1  ORF type:complete len:707 (-),score=239.83 GFUD01028268.1:117-2237(-)